MKTAEDFLIERGVVIKGAKTWPLNLTRDTHIGSKREIIQAMEDYAEYKYMFNTVQLILDSIQAKSSNDKCESATERLIDGKNVTEKLKELIENKLNK